MKLTGTHETIEEAAATTATPHEPPVLADAPSALLLLDQTVSAYMLGQVDGHEVHRVQELARSWAAPGPRLLPRAPAGDEGRAVLAGELDPPPEHVCGACGATTRERMADPLPATQGRRKWRDRPLPAEATSGLVTRDGLRPGAR